MDREPPSASQGPLLTPAPSVPGPPDKSREALGHPRNSQPGRGRPCPGSRESRPLTSRQAGTLGMTVCPGRPPVLAFLTGSPPPAPRPAPKIAMRLPSIAHAHVCQDGEQRRGAVQGGASCPCGVYRPRVTQGEATHSLWGPGCGGGVAVARALAPKAQPTCEGPEAPSGAGRAGAPGGQGQTTGPWGARQVRSSSRSWTDLHFTEVTLAHAGQTGHQAGMDLGLTHERQTGCTLEGLGVLRDLATVGWGAEPEASTVTPGHPGLESGG